MSLEKLIWIEEKVLKTKCSYGKIKLFKSCFASDFKGLIYETNIVKYESKKRIWPREQKDRIKVQSCENAWKTLHCTQNPWLCTLNKTKLKLREGANDANDGILIVLMEWFKLLKHKETFLFIQSQSYLMYIFGYCQFLFAINFECGR